MSVPEQQRRTRRPNLRISAEAIDQIEELAREYAVPRSRVVETAIALMHRSHRRRKP